MGVSAAEAVSRTRAHVVTRQTPQGMCLNFVWRMFGSLNSTGYAQGTLTTAYSAWLSSKHKHGPNEPIPVGAPVYFGPSPTRWDKNKNAGDVMVHIGGGIIGGTDVNGANTGFTTIAARAKAIQRPYLGWAGDFGGRDIDFGVTVVPTEHGSVIIPKQQKEDEMYFTSTTTGVGMALINGRLVGFRSAAHQDLFVRLRDGRGPFLPVEIDTMNSYLRQPDEELTGLIWGHFVDGSNGKQTAANRLAGADMKADDLSQAAIAAVAASAAKAVGGTGVQIDQKALADSITAGLAPTVAASVGKLSEEDLARVAAAVTDEQSKRLKS